ncbi:MAG: hypothetical protein QFB87_02505 [Patescibacteria group bacterium]|nr:hypothetical protein [Patescibacteria group bacterium]
MSSAEARHFYELSPATNPENGGAVDRQLLEQGIARIAMTVSQADFSELSQTFDACIAETPDLLLQSYHIVDSRLSNSAGYVRKEQKVNAAGRQIADPKGLMHFSESAYTRWQQQFKSAPRLLTRFLEAGFDIQHSLLHTARQHINDLATTHPNLSKLYFPPDGPRSLSFLRVIAYDSYDVTGTYADVAKPHFDIGGVTIQAYADAAGFWGAKDGPRGERTHYDTAPAGAYLFLGTEHAKVYGDDSYLKPLWHGVDRIIPEGQTHVPERHAVILFVDAPAVNHGITERDTLPHLYDEQVA